MKKTIRTVSALLMTSVLVLAGCAVNASDSADLSIEETESAVTAPTVNWPTPTATQSVSSTIKVSGTYDGAGKRFVGSGDLGSDDQSESQGPLFELADGATLSNVILGTPAADGVHCKGTCTLKNVWWEDVGEDAASQKGTKSSQVMTIDGGGAKHASDKVFQQNGPGTMVIKNFYVEDFGKLYRSCGNCKTQYARHVVVQNVTAVTSSASKTLVGVNENYGDVAELSGITVYQAKKKIDICERFKGNNTGAEPTKTGAGADGKVCKYDAASVVLQ